MAMTVGLSGASSGALVNELWRRLSGILQRVPLGGGMQQVGVDTERRLVALVLGHRDHVLVGIGHQRFAAFEVPLAPGRDHPDVGLQGVV